MQLEPFRNDPVLRQKLIEYVDVIVPMNVLKWHALRPSMEQYDFSGADELIEFAELNGKSVHGHTLLWQDSNPRWLETIASPRQLKTLLAEHIESVVGRYAGRIRSWDVVNEVIAHDPLTQGDWRKGIWYDALGPEYVEWAFKLAASADPSARLFINDYDLEDSSPRTQARQTALLRTIHRLQDKNISVQGVGLQAHLYAEREIGRENLASFIGEIKKLGLTVSVTELDVIDWKLPADPVERDRLVAATVEEFLTVVTQFITPQVITTWGLCDRYSWIGDTFARKDGEKARPLPFDENWRSKSFFDVLSSFTN